MIFFVRWTVIGQPFLVIGLKSKWFCVLFCTCHLQKVWKKVQFTPSKSDIILFIVNKYLLYSYRNWEKELSTLNRPSLLVAFIATFWKEYGILSLMCTCNDLIAQLAQPILLGQLLLYFRSGSSVTYHDALLYATGILLFNGIQTLSSNQIYMHGYHSAMKVRVAVCSLIYRKVSQMKFKNLTKKII